MPCSLGCSPPAGAPVSCKVKKRCFTYSQSRGIGVFFLDRCQISSEKKKKNKIRESLLWRNWDGGGLSAKGSDTARSAERRYGTCCAALLTGRCGGRGGGRGCELRRYHRGCFTSPTPPDMQMGPDCRCFFARRGRRGSKA